MLAGGAASFAAQVSAVVGEARYYLCTVKSFFYVCAVKIFFYMMMTTLLYGRGKRRFAAQLQHFPKLKSGGSGLFSDIEANALFVKRQLKFM
jgi:hypothetical protein